MVGIEVVAGLAAGWLWRKLRRAAGKADASIDAVIDGQLDRLDTAITAKLGGDPSLAQLTADSQGDDDSPRSYQRVKLALEDAVESDPKFAAILRELVTPLEKAQAQVAGDHLEMKDHSKIEARDGGIAGMKVEIARVDLSRPPRPGTE